MLEFIQRSTSTFLSSGRFFGASVLCAIVHINHVKPIFQGLPFIAPWRSHRTTINFVTFITGWNLLPGACSDLDLGKYRVCQSVNRKLELYENCVLWEVIAETQWIFRCIGQLLQRISCTLRSWVQEIFSHSRTVSPRLGDNYASKCSHDNFPIAPCVENCHNYIAMYCWFPIVGRRSWKVEKLWDKSVPQLS